LRAHGAARLVGAAVKCVAAPAGGRAERLPWGVGGNIWVLNARRRMCPDASKLDERCHDLHTSTWGPCALSPLPLPHRVRRSQFQCQRFTPCQTNAVGTYSLLLLLLIIHLCPNLGQCVVVDGLTPTSTCRRVLSGWSPSATLFVLMVAQMSNYCFSSRGSWIICQSPTRSHMHLSVLDSATSANSIQWLGIRIWTARQRSTTWPGFQQCMTRDQVSITKGIVSMYKPI
jgi:hypothetical protein